MRGSDDRGNGVVQDVLAAARGLEARDLPRCNPDALKAGEKCPKMRYTDYIASKSILDALCSV